MVEGRLSVLTALIVFAGYLLAAAFVKDYR